MRVEAEEVAPGEAAEEVRVGGVAELALGDVRGADEAVRVADVGQHLAEEVVAAPTSPSTILADRTRERIKFSLVCVYI